MSLYGKYRPTTFDEVVGNDETVAMLRALLAQEDPPHAYLLTGPIGCAKTTIARIAARELGCDPTGKDYYYVEMNSADDRGIDRIREIARRNRYLMSAFRPRFYLFDEAHKLTNDAQNALLKLLEDPAPPLPLLSGDNRAGNADRARSRALHRATGSAVDLGRDGGAARLHQSSGRAAIARLHLECHCRATCARRCRQDLRSRLLPALRDPAAGAGADRDDARGDAADHRQQQRRSAALPMIYELHPACAAWPAMTPEALLELVADIRAKGWQGGPVTLIAAVAAARQSRQLGRDQGERRRVHMATEPVH
jgi:hypothetical protein